MDKVGPQPVVDLVKKLGVEAEIPVVPSIALGTADLSVYEMVGAYSAFANKGVYTKPVMVTHIEDKNGTILYQFTPETDRKSTRLNSSHVKNSYAVFCLKKKNLNK